MDWWWAVGWNLIQREWFLKHSVLFSNLGLLFLNELLTCWLIRMDQMELLKTRVYLWQKPFMRIRIRDIVPTVLNMVLLHYLHLLHQKLLSFIHWLQVIKNEISFLDFWFGNRTSFNCLNVLIVLTNGQLVIRDLMALKWLLRSTVNICLDSWFACLVSLLVRWVFVGWIVLLVYFR